MDLKTHKEGSYFYFFKTLFETIERSNSSFNSLSKSTNLNTDADLKLNELHTYVNNCINDKLSEFKN